MRSSTLPLFLLALSPSLFAQGFPGLSFGGPDTFEAVTWNIERFPKQGQVTKDAVADIITALDVDVLALQEIDDRSALQDVVDSLPGYEAFYQSSFYAGLAYVYNSNTVQIQSIYEIYTTQPYWRPFPRSPVVMELTFQGQDVVIINNHFKCCGDGILDLSDPWDEETRRYDASNLLEQYIAANFANDRVVMLGDLNDILTDAPANNVFQTFLNAPFDYQFADSAIAAGSVSNWSYPGWPSHLDHILMTDELFTDFAAPCATIQTIRIDDHMSGGWSEYDAEISDHRPVGLKVPLGTSCSGGTPSSETVRLGTPPNPDALRPGVTSGPVIGSNWDPYIDHTTFEPAAFLDFIGVSVQGPANFTTAMGTLLVAPPLLNPATLNLFAGAPFSIPIPYDLSIVGLQVWAQGGCASSAFHLTNALDLVIGDL